MTERSASLMLVGGLLGAVLVAFVVLLVPFLRDVALSGDACTGDL